jgi:hypothetical protein
LRHIFVALWDGTVEGIGLEDIGEVGEGAAGSAWFEFGEGIINKVFGERDLWVVCVIRAGARVGGARNSMRRVEVGTAEIHVRGHLGGGKGRLNALVGGSKIFGISKGLGRRAGVIVGSKVDGVSIGYD